MSDNDSVIVDALKSDNDNIRIQTNSKWLYWRETSCCYVVLEHKYAAKNTRTVCVTDDLVVAMKALTE